MSIGLYQWIIPRKCTIILYQFTILSTTVERKHTKRSCYLRMFSCFLSSSSFFLFLLLLFLLSSSAISSCMFFSSPIFKNSTSTSFFFFFYFFFFYFCSPKAIRQSFEQSLTEFSLSSNPLYRSGIKSQDG